MLDGPPSRKDRQLAGSQPNDSPEALLAAFWRRNGYVRVVNEKLRQELGKKYKKGYEVRLVVRAEGELAQIRPLLEQVGFKAGRPFRKHKQLVQPVYGKRAVEWFRKQNIE